MMNVVSRLLNARNWPILALLVSFGLWMGALGFQYIGGMPPCQMCYWQRHAHKAVIAISALALISRYALKTDKLDKVFLILIGLAFLVSFGLAFWHMGVEYTWWEGPQSCMGGAVTIDVTDILQALEAPVKMPSCGEVPWSMLGLSMAGYNAILSAGAAILSFLFAVKAK